MSLPPDFLQDLRKAKSLASQNSFAEAERIYQRLLSGDYAREGVLRELFQLYMRQGKVGEAISCLEELARDVPTKPEYHLYLAELAQSAGDLTKSIAAYQGFLKVEPDRPNTIYNLALVHREVGQLREALEMYRRALEKNIDRKEEVYTNIGVIHSELRQEEQARASFEKAIAFNASYIPAYFNLGGLLEEAGDREVASSYYKKILKLDKQYYPALCRLAHLAPSGAPDDPLIDQISMILKNAELSDEDREELNFSLGKLLDSCGSYDRAFTCYDAGNRLGAHRFVPYDSGRQSRLVDELIRFFSSDWFGSVRSSASESPVFICGMFRSGSTLVEQILSGHSKIVAGGELGFFPDFIKGLGDEYPRVLSHMGLGYFDWIGRRYLEYLEERFPGGLLVTDKRPDNFMHIGLIKSALPNSRVIWTRRGLLDNCLSIYFQQLGGGMNYSIDLDTIGHYYSEQVRLMKHWESLFPESVFEVQYESLVRGPEAEVDKLLDFLGLRWEVSCLDFSVRKNYVKTASIWQVRESIHQGSAERYKHYSAHLKPLEKYLVG